MTDELQRKIQLLPTYPGVYVMQDDSGNVIYVGKAKNLKNRVTTYFRNGFKTEKVAKMVMNIADFYYVITPSEGDALSLENNLIKKYKPKYNILLKDDKTYPYIRVDLKENFPSFKIVRKVKNDGAKYFGPFMLGVSVSDILEIVKEAYLIRPCSSVINTSKPKKECLNYHLGLCLSPCSNKCSKEEYLKNVKKAIDFLSGNNDEAEKLLTAKMKASADNEEFERAVDIREKIKMLSKLKDKKITSISRFISADIISIKSDGIYSSVSVLLVRSGRMSGVKTFGIDVSLDSQFDGLDEFILRYYSEDKEIPDEIIIPHKIDENGDIAQYLSNLKGKKVEFITPFKGVKMKLLKMAEKNAEDYLTRQINKVKHKDDMTILACEKLKEILSLKKYPRRIECFDISHISGVDKVGSMTVFIDGVASKNDYRRFKIKTVEGNNDFACLLEVLTRRLKKLGTDEENFKKPDLIVIDGGKGQLSAVKNAFLEYGSDIEYISLAEREEEIYTVNSNKPIILPKSDYCLKLLQRIRDEAHRFAITYNRTLRGKHTLSSILTEIDGIGRKKRNDLLNEFKDIKSIKSASVEELMKVGGIGEKQAKKIKEYFDGNI